MSSLALVKYYVRLVSFFNVLVKETNRQAVAEAVRPWWQADRLLAASKYMGRQAEKGLQAELLAASKQVSALVVNRQGASIPAGQTGWR
jgi:hypothetical protein